jgi:hypothetical protein
MTADDDYEQALEHVADCKKDLKLSDGKLKYKMKYFKTSFIVVL